ncbi:hypothetical protein FIBSPDRAFT_849995, partial [Athelia psychrophila]
QPVDRQHHRVELQVLPSERYWNNVWLGLSIQRSGGGRSARLWFSITCWRGTVDVEHESALDAQQQERVRNRDELPRDLAGREEDLVQARSVMDEVSRFEQRERHSTALEALSAARTELPNSPSWAGGLMRLYLKLHLPLHFLLTGLPPWPPPDISKVEQGRRLDMLSQLYALMLERAGSVTYFALRVMKAISGAALASAGITTGPLGTT